MPSARSSNWSRYRSAHLTLTWPGDLTFWPGKSKFAHKVYSCFVRRYLKFDIREKQVWGAYSSSARIKVCFFAMYSVAGFCADVYIRTFPWWRLSPGCFFWSNAEISIKNRCRKFIGVRAKWQLYKKCTVWHRNSRIHRQNIYDHQFAVKVARCMIVQPAAIAQPVHIGIKPPYVVHTWRFIATTSTEGNLWSPRTQ